MTPEGKVKQKIKKWLDFEFPDHYRIMPRGGPFGQAGTPDFVLCWNGIFIAIEVKALGGELTALQLASLKQIERAGGVAAVVKGYDEVRLRAIKQAVLKKWNSPSVPTSGQPSAAANPSSTRS